MIVSYGSLLDELFTYVRDQRPALHLPKVVTFGADPLSEGVRRWLQHDCGIEVLGTYKAAETPPIGFECDRHLGYHLNIDLCATRLIAPGGGEADDEIGGEVVISNLLNRGTVLLNYRLGDTMSITRQRYPCGRTLPLRSYLSRAKHAWLELGPDRRIHVQALLTIVTRDPDVRRATGSAGRTPAAAPPDRGTAVRTRCGGGASGHAAQA